MRAESPPPISRDWKLGRNRQNLWFRSTETECPARALILVFRRLFTKRGVSPYACRISAVMGLNGDLCSSFQMELVASHAPEVRTGVQCFRFSKSTGK